MGISNLIGSSPKLRSVIDDVEVVAPVDSTVLIQGETGTGKEVIARAIHERSPRCRNRFVAVNCAAIPGPLLENELFGHEKGAFTGAISQAIGRFQLADRGTLFLDEIGELPLELQPKLLRALHEKQIDRLGGRQTVQVDVRVIAATNQNLAQLIAERKFRADLYYRLNVFPMTLPPLRERAEDIPLLVEYFVQRFAEKHGRSIERAVIITSGPVLSDETAAPLRNRIGPCAECTPVKTLADAERAHIIKTLRETNWVVGGRRGAAIRLGVARTTLLARMNRLGISSRGPDVVTGPLDSPSDIEEHSNAGRFAPPASDAWADFEKANSAVC